MEAQSRAVQAELLAIAFGAYRRALAASLAFAALTVAIFRADLPPGLLAGWLAAMALLGGARVMLARAYFRAAPGGDPRPWVARSAVASGVTGLAWGALGAAAIVLAPGVTLYPLWIAFLVAYFTVLGSQNTAAHPSMAQAYAWGGLAPMVVAALATPSPNYALRLLALGVALAAALASGRIGNRYVAESVRMRLENRELLDDLTRANAAKGRFLAAASHDLRQPMQAVVLHVEHLQERLSEPEHHRIAGDIHRSVTAMTSMVNEILDISRLEAGTVAPQPAAFHVDVLLDELRRTFTHAAARRDLAFRVRACGAVIRSDPVLLQRVLTNLADNALRYSVRGGVLVGCRRRAEGTWIEVWDTGVGIAPDQHQAIFREFHQVANPQRDRGQGLGLGLAIVERTLRLLDHRLELRSRPGRGSVFRVLVPHGDRAELARPVAAPRHDSLEGREVVVIEDNAEVRMALARLLEGWGCRTHAVGDGTELDALFAAQPLAPDVFITDFRLPGAEDGIALLARMRALHPRARCVLLSGDVAAPVLRAAQAAGFEMLHKPLRPAQLRALLAPAPIERVPA